MIGFRNGRTLMMLLGDAVLANMLLLGFAWQKGWVPVGWAALVRAVELNGVARESDASFIEGVEVSGVSELHCAGPLPCAEPVCLGIGAGLCR